MENRVLESKILPQDFVPITWISYCYLRKFASQEVELICEINWSSWVEVTHCSTFIF